jgi:hypothetical protein
VDVLAVLSQCNFAKDFGLVLAMLMHHSGGDPFVVREADAAEVADDEYGDAGDAQARARTRDAALADMRRFERPLIGLMPVPPAWAAIYERRPEDLLDPCTNIAVATAQLSAYERRCAGRRDPRSCALHAYAQEIDALLFELEVLDALAQDNPPRTAPAVIDTSTIVGADPLVSGTPSRGDIGGMFVFTTPAPAAEPQPTAKPNVTKTSNSAGKQPAKATR